MFALLDMFGMISKVYYCHSNVKISGVTRWLVNNGSNVWGRNLFMGQKKFCPFLNKGYFQLNTGSALYWTV